MSRASSLTPNSTNPITIFVTAGYYPETITAASNVIVTGVLNSTYLCGPVSWSASSGINSGYASANEIFMMNYINLQSDPLSLSSCGTFTANTASKSNPAWSAILTLSSVDVSISTIITMSYTSPHVFYIQNCNLKSAVAFNAANGYIQESNLGAVTIPSSGIYNFYYTRMTSVNSTGVSALNLVSSYIPTTSFFTSTTVNCFESFVGTVTGQVNSILYLTSCTYLALAGDSTTTADRDLTFQSSTSASGTNTVTFPIKYIHAPSFISFSQTSGTSTFLQANSLTTSGFTYSTSVVGNTYTIAVFLKVT
jgi:hypothetical protein